MIDLISLRTPPALRARESAALPVSCPEPRYLFKTTLFLPDAWITHSRCSWPRLSTRKLSVALPIAL
jgi:hypothetical protein